MVLVLSRGRWQSRWSWIGIPGVLAGLLVLADSRSALGQAPTAKARSTAAPDEDSGKAKADDDQDAAPAPAPDVAPGPVADPSQTRRVAPVEVFKDPAAEAILDIDRLVPVKGAPIVPNDILRVKEMAANPNVTLDQPLIDRVVRELASRLTDKKNILALLETPEEGKKAHGDAGKAIQDTTNDLLEPIFRARGMKNEAFLTTYRRALQQYLPPLLKNHLVPRVQAMIVLGEAAYPSPEALSLFQSEIASKSQVLWVKLWALEGITNIKKGGAPFPADTESRASRVISDFLEKQKELPWLIQLRGLEALGWLRQAYVTTQPERAHMANTAMAFLADTDAKLEVRAEAARALGLMQVSRVPKYNFKLVASSTGQLAADLATEIDHLYSDTPPRAENPLKARYLTALLVGPVFQGFEGVKGETGSGFLRTPDSDSTKYSRKVFDLIKPIAQQCVDLLLSPAKEYKKRKQTLTREIAALRGFIEENPPPSRRLVETGREYGGEQAGGQLAAPAQPLAGRRRGQ